MPIEYFVRLMSTKRKVDGPYVHFQQALHSAETWADSVADDLEVVDDSAAGLVVKRIVKGRGKANEAA